MAKLNKELAIEATIHALDRLKFASLISNLLFKDTLTMQDISQAFQIEQVERDCSEGRSSTPQGSSALLSSHSTAQKANSPLPHHPTCSCVTSVA
jgi:hypothetical protein